MERIKLKENRHYAPLPRRSHAEWLAARRDYLGASEMPIIMGATSEAWGSPFSLQAEKLGFAQEVERDPAVQEMMEWGNRMEPLALRALGDELGARVRHCRTSVRSKRYPWLGCTPDGRVGQRRTGDPSADRPAFVQAKNCAGFERWRVTAEGRLEPMRVWVQLQAELAVTGDRDTYVVAVVQGHALKWARIDRDDDFIEELMIPAGEEFMAALRSGEMLPSDYSAATSRALLAMFPKADPDKTVTLPASFADLDDRYRELRAERKRIDVEMSGISNEVKTLMGDAIRGNVSGSRGYWRWNDVKGGSYTRKPGRRLQRYGTDED